MQYTKIDNETMMKIYTQYKKEIQSNKQRAEMNALKSATPFINLCMYNFHVRKQYLGEFYSLLLADFFRSLDTYDPTKGVKIFGWCWRLCSQTAWRFIRDKQKEIEKNGVFIDISECFGVENGEMNGEETLIQKQTNDEFSDYLNDVLVNVICTPLEIELYSRQRGVNGYKQETNLDKIAEEMNLTRRTVEQMQTRNANNMAKFRKYLRDNKFADYDAKVCKQYKESKKSK